MNGDAQIDVKRILGFLKPFQRRSVDYVFDRLYGKDPTRRFLLADEVGLGKTLVARGVVARTIEHLRNANVDRIDVVYICSNSDIARQNISRLNVTGKPDFALASRITLLPKTVRDLTGNRLNFVSFTPGTSFDLGQTTGTGEERALLYWLLRRIWPKTARGAAPKNVLQGWMTRESFRKLLERTRNEDWIDPGLARRFRMHLRQADKDLARDGKPTQRGRFRDLCRRFARSRKPRNVPKDDREDSTRFIGDLRNLLAATCIDALEPDLVILDEFQRFKDLLQPDNPAGVLAKHLFEWGSARVLLLSATPYKMYTLSSESGTDDHYRDFMDTLRFLLVDEARVQQASTLLERYRRACTQFDRGDLDALRTARQELERQLRRVMCRTEKLAVTADRSGMLREVGSLSAAIAPRHIESYLETRRIADLLERGEVVDLWKSSPYLLNFMDPDGYKLKESLRIASESDTPNPDLARELKAARRGLLDRAVWERYGAIDPCHPLLERMLQETIEAGWWRLLWVPPALPYYELSGPFADGDRVALTKRLVFSSWHVVPRSITAILSYEAERRMVLSHERESSNTQAARDRRRPLLMFSRSEDRLTGMPVLAMLYPSLALARLGDPWALDAGAQPLPTLDHVLGSVTRRIAETLKPLLAGVPSNGPEDEAWYWAAPILLDRQLDRDATREWFADIDWLAQEWSGGEDEARGWRDHVLAAQTPAFGRRLDLGRPPSDLAEVLALLAVGGPANCALRSLVHTIGRDANYAHPITRQAAGRIAWGFRSLFNTPEIITLIRGMNGDEPYWRRVLEYASAGCLQSVLDEYLHVLIECEGLLGHPTERVVKRLADVVAASVGLRTATPGFDWIEARGDDQISIDSKRARARFAMRFGDELGERMEGSIRRDTVRAAFNSPFWPFVLATTSVGQEGLDFHAYCHAVVHWNLPSNPVDLEQREGRVHRYKGHAVRKNVAAEATRRGLHRRAGTNPWDDCFRLATEVSGTDGDISPFWVFPIPEGAVIERHALTLPLSREAIRLPQLRSSLAVYRMVFGQPRQDDLLAHLKSRIGDARLAEVAREMAVDLTPMRVDRPVRGCPRELPLPGSPGSDSLRPSAPEP